MSTGFETAIVVPQDGSGLAGAASEHPVPLEADQYTVAPEGRALTLAKAGAIAYEILPWDDAARYSLLAFSQEQTHNPIFGAVTLGLATLATESAAVLASYKWIAEDRIRPFFDTVRGKIDSFKDKLNKLVPPLKLGSIVPNIPQDPEVGEKLPVTTQAAVALNLGSVVMLEAMQRRDPSRTAEQNRQTGLRTAALVSGYMAAEGGLLSAGFENLTNPTYLSLAALGIAGLHYAAHKLRKLGKKGKGDIVDEIPDAPSEFIPRYDLSVEELRILDRQMVDSVKSIYPEAGVYSALISPDHPYSNFVRGHEAQYFPEVLEFPAEQEDNTLLFALVDTRPESDRVVHVGTVSGPAFQNNKDANPDSTGFLFVDELISLGNFTAEEFRTYYAERGINLESCIAVETNIRVGERAEKYEGLTTVQLGYLTLFGLLPEAGPKASGDSVVFASINQASKISFDRAGLRWDPLMGSEEMVTPESLVGRKSEPVILRDPTVFASMGPQLPRIHFGVKQEVA